MTERYVEVIADIVVRGAARKFKIWVDLAEIAARLGPRAFDAKNSVSTDCRGAVRVTFLP